MRQKHLFIENNIFLSLNAVKEVTRLGETERCFNVVVEQVRSLSLKSRETVKNTSSMLERISSSSKLQECNSKETLSEIESIAIVSEDISASTEEAAAATEEQSSTMAMLSFTSQKLLDIAENVLLHMKRVKLYQDHIEVTKKKFRSKRDN